MELHEIIDWFENTDADVIADMMLRVDKNKALDVSEYIEGINLVSYLDLDTGSLFAGMEIDYDGINGTKIC
jgi:hypothetical protein